MHFFKYHRDFEREREKNVNTTGPPRVLIQRFDHNSTGVNLLCPFSMENHFRLKQFQSVIIFKWTI